MITNRLVSHDQIFRQCNTNQIIVNDLVYDSDQNNIIINHIMTSYSTEVIDTVPKCMCPEGDGLKGRVRLGMTCPQCGCQVQEVFDQIDNKLWLRAINVDGEMIPFMNPIFWMLLSRTLYGSNRSQGEADYVRWLCDPHISTDSVKTSIDKFKRINGILENALGGKRDYLHFIKNLGVVLEYMVKSDDFNKKKKSEVGQISNVELLYSMYLQEMQENNGSTIFSEYLPILGKNIFILENTAKGKFTNLSSGHNINVVRGWLKFCRDSKERELSGLPGPTKEKVGHEVAKVINKLANLYNKYNKDQIYQKQGILRKHAYGARSHLTGRALITSIEGPHDRRDIQLPWSMGVLIYQPHLMSRLVKRGLSHRETLSKINHSVMTYDPMIHELLTEIRLDSPEGKSPALFHRNQMSGSLVA